MIFPYIWSESRSSAKPSTHDVRFINLNAVADVKLVRESTKEQGTLPNLNLNKVFIYFFFRYSVKINADTAVILKLKGLAVKLCLVVMIFAKTA